MKMTSTINSILKTEITFIPSLLRKCFGRAYNNALLNGITWMFVVFYILHITFDHALDLLFKKMKYKEYLRIRLKSSVWYLGFYSTFLIYIQATLYTQGLRFMDFRSFLKQSLAPEQIQLGFVLVATFYLHSAFWEQTRHYNIFGTLTSSATLLNIVFLYIFRFSEGFFRFTSLICIVNISLEITRLLVIQAELSKLNTTKSKIILGVSFCVHIFIFCLNYMVAIPYMLIYSRLFVYQESNPLAVMAVMPSWLVLEIFPSAIYKSAIHLYNHKPGVSRCPGLLNCALFNGRWDTAYVILILRKGIKDREEKVMSLRKPKNRSIVVQTLKCMVALKRKLSAKRQSLDSNQERLGSVDNVNCAEITEIPDEKTDQTEDKDEIGSETEKNKVE